MNQIDEKLGRRNLARYLSDKHDELQERVDDISDKLEKMRADLDSLQNRLDELQKKVHKDLDDIQMLRRKLNHKGGAE